jgi:Leucine-rich repeat (LRR) protein
MAKNERAYYLMLSNTEKTNSPCPLYFVAQNDNLDDPFFSSLLPLHNYQQQHSIAVSSLPLPVIAANYSLPAELIEKIQSFCSHNDLLSLTSVDKAAFATRVCNLRVQQRSLKTVADTEALLSYCQVNQEKEARDLANETQQSPKRSRFERVEVTLPSISFTKEYLQRIKTLTLTVSDHFTAEQYALLFSYLSGVNHLTVHSPAAASSLSPLFKAVQHLNLHHLAMISVVSFENPKGSTIYDPFKFYLENIKDNVPDELWQLTTLETLILENFECIRRLSAEISQLSNLTSLTLKDMPKLAELPDDIGQLNVLKSLTLKNVGIFRLPNTLSYLSKLETLIIEGVDLDFIQQVIGNIPALKSLTIDHPELREVSSSYEFLFSITQLETLILRGMRYFNGPPAQINTLKALKHLELAGKHQENSITLPSTVGQLESLETLVLKDLSFEVLPDEIGECRALKHLELEGENMVSLMTLPSTVGQLENLETLILKDLSRLEALPDEIGQCRALKSLQLINLKSLGELPTTLAQLDKLETRVINN